MHHVFYDFISPKLEISSNSYRIFLSYTETLKWLISNGANHRIATKKGRLAFDVAMAHADRQGQRDVTAFLKKCGTQDPISFQTFLIWPILITNFLTYSQT